MDRISGTTALWYASRATGVVALVLLTGVLTLGILVTGRGRLPGLPRFGPVSLHRSLSLLAVAFVAAHVVTAIADPFVRIGVAASVVPFTSGYEPFWLGLGAVAADLMLALIATSLLRARLGRRTWRAVHWLAYLTWPVAFAQSIGSGSDLRHGGLALLAWGCALVVAAAAAVRVTGALRAAGPAERARLDLAAAPGSRGARNHGARNHGARNHGARNAAAPR